MTIYFVENPTAVVTALGKSCFGPFEGAGAREAAIDAAKKLAAAPGAQCRVFGTDGTVVTAKGPSASAVTVE